MSRRHSPSPSARCRRRAADRTPTERTNRGQDEEARHVEARDCVLPGALPPDAAVRPQVLSSQQAFTATSNGHVACICGGSIVECDADSFQTNESHVFHCGPQPRRLQCCALSPCGRYLAAGENGIRTAAVLVFDRERRGPATVLRGHHHGVRLLAWSPRSDFLVSIGNAESEQSDHQLFLWSWPQGERVTGAMCARGVVDLVFSPNQNVFAVIGSSAVKCWFIEKPQDGLISVRHRSHPQLVGHAVSAQALSVVRKLDENDRCRQSDERLVSAAWSDDGEACVLHVLGRRGRICSIVHNEAVRWVDINQKANVVVWVRKLCNSQVQHGVLLCGLVGGTVQILDAGSLRAIATVAGAGGSSDAVGVSVSVQRDAFWVLYADRSLARWRGLHDAPDLVLPAPVPSIRDAQTVPQAAGLTFQVPQVVTCTDRGLQLWTSAAEGLKIESRTEPGTSRTGELTALAVSPWAVACGHRGGEVHILALPRLHALDTLPVKHNGDVLALCFGSMPAASDGPLLLASASHDRCVMIFRLDVRRQNASGVQCCNVSLLLNLPGHSTAIQSIAILGGAEQPDVQCAVATSDKLLLLRDLELSPTTAAVRRSHKHVGRARWIGLCVHPERAMLFAACGDKRVLQLDSAGRCRQAVRLVGPDVEVTGPVRLSEHGRILAIGVAGSSPSSDPGIVLLDTWAGLKPFARLMGNADPVSGIAFLGCNNVLGCWSDGAMLGWDRVDQHQQQQQQLQLPVAEGRRCDDFEKVASSPHHYPLRAGTPHSECTALSPQRSPFRSFNPQRARPPKMRQTENDNFDSTPVPAYAASSCPDGLLERLLASSPRPPRWAGGKTKDGIGSESQDDEENADPHSQILETSDVQSSTAAEQLGRWARGSQVGKPVHSTSDLLAISSISDLHSVAEETGKGSLLTGTAGAGLSQAPRVLLFTESSEPLASMLEGSGESSGDLEPPSGDAQSAVSTASRISNVSKASGSGQLRPLPPMPRFPPPDATLNSQRINSIVLPLSPAKSLGANSPCTGAKGHEAKSPLLRIDFEDVRASADAIVSELRTREPKPVLAEVIRSLLAFNAGVSSENIPPVADAENAKVATVSLQDTTSGCSLPSLPQLRNEIQRISSDAVRVLLPGPEAAEVRALLRRVDSLMRSEGTSCTIDVAR